MLPSEYNDRICASARQRVTIFAWKIRSTGVA
jgi:hypothetical protein